MKRLFAILLPVVLATIVLDAPDANAQKIDNPPVISWVSEVMHIEGTVGRYRRANVEIQLFVSSYNLVGNNFGLRPLPFRVPATVNLGTGRFSAEFDVWNPHLGNTGDPNVDPGWHYAGYIPGCIGLVWLGEMRADLYVNGLKVDEYYFNKVHDCPGNEQYPYLPGPPVGLGGG